MAPESSESCPERREEDAGARPIVDHMENVEEEDDAELCQRHLISDEVENFYLQCGAAAVSIMQLPMCLDEEVIRNGAGLGEIYLVGQSVSESSEIRVLAEKWTLDLQPKFPPRFLVKTVSGWIRVQKPKVVYRRIMSDGLTLAHFLHYVRKNPSASAGAAREHLANEFRQFGEKPSIEKLADFLPVIRRYTEVHLKMENSKILKEFFPSHFSDVVESCSALEMKGVLFHDEQLAATGNREITEEAKEDVKRGQKSISKYIKAKAQRANVQAELRSLHSQWCTLLGGRATVKADKKPLSNEIRSSARQNQVSGKSERPKLVLKKPVGRTPSSKKAEHERNVSKKDRQSVHKSPEIPESKKRRALECETPIVSKRSLRHVPSLESKKSTLNLQEKLKPLAKVLNAQISEERTITMTQKKWAPKSSLENGQWPPTPARGVGPMGVHSPSTDLFDRLEDPPICTICDDGGDLICCEGPCQRHFHSTAGTDTNCQTLGLTAEQVKKIDTYYCKNCLLHQHQCFICQELGSSAPSSLGPQEVYICDAPGCRKFYHAACVSKVIDPEQDWRAMTDRIERGLHGFLCPRHSCAVCMSKEIQPGVFVQCRRCPKAWHRDCLTDFSASCELPKTSIWKHYDREFVYCKQHKILPRILTPAQDHVRFPKE